MTVEWIPASRRLFASTLPDEGTVLQRKWNRSSALPGNTDTAEFRWRWRRGVLVIDALVNVACKGCEGRYQCKPGPCASVDVATLTTLVRMLDVTWTNMSSPSCSWSARGSLSCLYMDGRTRPKKIVGFKSTKWVSAKELADKTQAVAFLSSAVLETAAYRPAFSLVPTQDNPTSDNTAPARSRTVS